MQPTSKQTYAIPLSIVIAGVLIAGSVLWGRGGTSVAPNALPSAEPKAVLSSAELIKNAPGVRSNEHILGNPDAKVVVVEYSDIDCPYCRIFHPTMQNIISEYGASGQVSWVYRHFPLESHPNAYPQALATECVAKQYGESEFWRFISALMEVEFDDDGAPISVISDNLSADSRVTLAANKIGLESLPVVACMNAQTYADVVNMTRTEALNAGLGQNNTGTPYSIIISGDKRTLIDGAQPYNVVKALIDQALASY